MTCKCFQHFWKNKPIRVIFPEKHHRTTLPWREDVWLWAICVMAKLLLEKFGSCKKKRLLVTPSFYTYHDHHHSDYDRHHRDDHHDHDDLSPHPRLSKASLSCDKLEKLRRLHNSKFFLILLQSSQKSPPPQSSSSVSSTKSRTLFGFYCCTHRHRYYQHHDYHHHHHHHDELTPR